MFGFFASTKRGNFKTLGQLGEEAARREYEQRGYKIVAANFFNRKGKRLGEVDFIAIGQGRIAFVEVKTRSLGSGRFGSGADAVNYYKQQKILKSVKIFLQQQPKYQALLPQIDVCVMEYSQIDKSFKPAKIIMNAVEDWN